MAGRIACKDTSRFEACSCTWPLSLTFYKLLEIEREMYARFPRLVKALSTLRTYIGNNRYLIPHYSERYHNGAAIATGFVESTVNEVVSRRFCKKQQMQWAKEGAYLLLQTRVRTLNGELGAIFKGWYPDMDLEGEEIAIAA